MKNTLTGLEEARNVIRRKFKTSVSTDFSGNILHTDGSSPYASMKAHQAFVIASALINTDAKVITIATSSGFFEEFNQIWQARKDIDWKFGMSDHPYHLSFNQIKNFAPVYSGGLRNYAELRRKRILEFCNKICPDISPDRLVVHDLAMSDLAKETTLENYVESSLSGERIGRIPCPYCTFRYRQKRHKDDFIYHPVVHDYRTIHVQNWHAKCPARKVLISMLERPLSDVIQETGFVVTGRSALRFFSSNLSHFGADKIAVKDYADSSGVMNAVSGVIKGSKDLLVTTRTSVSKTFDELIGLGGNELLEIVRSHKVVSDGSVFEI